MDPDPKGCRHCRTVECKLPAAQAAMAARGGNMHSLWVDLFNAESECEARSASVRQLAIRVRAAG